MLKVLFVDDEKKVLDGIRRSLRSMRSEWEMYYASGGHEALSIMERVPCDVVVSDMKMPEMSGEKLLSWIQEKYPETARIVLSGHCDQATAFQLVGSEHFYLAKPCPAKLLIDTIQNAYYTGRQAESDDVSAREVKEALMDLSKTLVMRGQLNYTDLPNQVKMWMPDSVSQVFAPVMEKHSTFVAKGRLDESGNWLDDSPARTEEDYSWDDYFSPKRR